MTFVVGENCINCKFTDCVQVCPVDCFFEGPNFLVIDEGFGSLDSENLSNMKGAFDYLKTRFDSVFIISHLDTIKDFMDYLLPINVEKGYSNIIYN